MDKPVIAARKPQKVELTAGEEYAWCRCGRSSGQPFCDGSHRGTSFKPLKFTAEETGDAFLCQCKSTGNAPFCDGAHARLPADADSPEAPPPPGASSNGAPSAMPTPEEPTVQYIHELARDGLSKVGRHGEMGAMGVPRSQLPDWNDIQILPAQFARKPLLDEVDVASELVIGPNAREPLTHKITLFVSDMSFGSLSEQAKVALATGAELAGTGI